MNKTEELIKEIGTGLWRWFDFMPGSSLLYIGDVGEGDFQINDVKISYVSLEVSCQENWQLNHRGHFDYIISVADLEKQIKPIEILSKWKTLLNSTGCLLLGFNNRFGIRYFCGDRDPYTKRNFDSIENYYQAYANSADIFNGRMYNHVEIEHILRQAGLNKFKFFSVLTDLKNPSMIYSEDYLPNEDLSSRLFPTYNYPSTVFLSEETLYASLIANGMFHKMANAYLIECPLAGNFSDVLHVTCSIERGKENALFTIIHNDNIVEKRAIYPEGKQRLKNLEENIQDLKSHGVSVVNGKLINDSYIMPYIKAETGDVYLKRLLRENKEKFFQELDHFRDMILRSSEIVEDGEEGIILKKGYADMVLINSFYIDGEFFFYDQEDFIENCPLNMMMARVIRTLYFGNVNLNSILHQDILYERYGLLENKNKWLKMGWEFLNNLRKDKELSKYHSKIRCNPLIVNANRQRLNFSTEQYQRIFIDIFDNADTRKLILFGAGRYTQRFIELYAMDYDIEAIIDNNQEQWGKELAGVRIQSPNILKQFQSGEYKVIICIKKYTSVMKQLDAMGVSEYSIYDPNNNYPRKRKPIVADNVDANQPVTKKKYHTGYIAGVFDLYHIGHLNMFKRAKEQCDYLIVGIVTDEGVRKYKGVEPFVPFEERIEMVKSCRYVDEVVAIPPTYRDTIDAWKLHHFDVQFSGSDYINNDNWLASKEFLERHGADLVFFSYTQSTSSTKLKKLIDQKLI
ncbi:MAG: adenylyltransferase/cytidyltransferase family protein [Selenomonadaceae bacterium]|nr:adenylyltransferase/cytidyltransferase family protein [Selenomonadaceae bacterium]